MPGTSSLVISKVGANIGHLQFSVERFTKEGNFSVTYVLVIVYVLLK